MRTFDIDGKKITGVLNYALSPQSPILVRGNTVITVGHDDMLTYMAKAVIWLKGSVQRSGENDSMSLFSYKFTGGNVHRFSPGQIEAGIKVDCTISNDDRYTIELNNARGGIYTITQLAVMLADEWDEIQSSDNPLTEKWEKYYPPNRGASQ